ncbi:hypothetical protein [Streptomyces olivochromogenes]|nr:hypothetical protein [Streptomyces olivochromogenes]
MEIRTGVSGGALGVWVGAVPLAVAWGAAEPGPALPSDVRIARREGTRHG